MSVKRVKAHSVTVFKSSDTDQIEYYSENYQDLFDFCYFYKMRGQVVEKKFTHNEFYLLKLMTPCIIKTKDGDFLSV